MLSLRCVEQAHGAVQARLHWNGGIQSTMLIRNDSCEGLMDLSATWLVLHTDMQSTKMPYHLNKLGLVQARLQGWAWQPLEQDHGAILHMLLRELVHACVGPLAAAILGLGSQDSAQGSQSPAAGPLATIETREANPAEQMSGVSGSRFGLLEG